MKSYIYLCQYNNYFNRQIKRAGDTLGDYDSYVVDSTANANFNPNDGISGEIIMNTSETGDYVLVVDSDSTPSETATVTSRWFVIEQQRMRNGQYKITLRRDVIADNYENVLTAPCYIEKGIISDSSDPAIFNSEGMQLNQIKTSISEEQGGDENGELLLKDKTKCPWIVGYIAKNAGEIKGTVDWDSGRTVDLEITTPIASWEYYQYKDTDYIGPVNNPVFVTNYQLGLNLPLDMQYIKVDSDGNAVSKGLTGVLGAALKVPYTSGIDSQTAKLMGAAYKSIGMSNFISDVKTLIDGHTEVELKAFTDLDNSIVKDSDGKYYRVSVNSTGTLTKSDEHVVSGQDLYTRMASAVTGSGAFQEGYDTPDDKSFEYSCTAPKYRIIIDELKDYATSYDIPSTRATTKDAVYDIFCIPYGSISVYDESTGSSVMTTDKELGILTAISMSQALGGTGSSSKLYDLQLLPYCPMQGSLIEGGIKIDTTLAKKNYAYVTDASGNDVGIILLAEESSGSFTINSPLSIPRDQVTTKTTHATTLTADAKIISSTATSCKFSWVKQVPANSTLNVGMRDLIGSSTSITKNITSSIGLNTYVTTVTGTGMNVLVASSTHQATVRATYTTTSTEYENTLAHDLKVANECDLYRLCSPNFSGQFEFSVAKNGGTVGSFDVDYTYKPYNPYIHVVPDFHNMYGYDANDARGLICNGDFSFGAIADQWQSYEIQNKNYNSIFNRQIENMDKNNKIAMQEAGWQSLAGIGTGAAAGAAAGTIVGGGPVGAIIGGAAGAVTSAAGGIADMINMKNRQVEARSYAVDQFNYQLGNIKALPYSLTKCSALTKNNKLFPFIEYYTCTETERDALESKITYNGMTVMRIGKIQDWRSDEEQYVQGQIIRLSDIAEDSHSAEAIYEEISKGVYL